MRIHHHIGRILAAGLLTCGLTAAAAPGRPQILARTQLTRRLAAAVAAMLGLAIAILAASPATALTSRAVRQDVNRPAGMTGAGPIHGQVPVALRAAVRRTLGVYVSRAAATQQAELTASDGTGDNEFGWSVAISGSIAVVGAFGKNFNTGAAYVFVQSGTSWTQQAELSASDGGSADWFGVAVAISGSTAVVGALRTGAANGPGAAYVFTRSGTTWTQQAELLDPRSKADNDNFARWLVISGSTVVVGASGSYSRPTAYVFTRSGTTWAQQAKLSGVGGAVAISGSTVLAAAGGAVDVFTRSGTTWTQQATLTDPSSTPYDLFGSALAISGSTAVVGADGPVPTGTGAAYVFTRSGTTWTEQAKLTASDGGAGDYFGGTIAIHNSTVVIGAYHHNSDTGAAYVFTRSGTAWSEQAELTASDGTADDQFGYSVAISKTTAIIGANGNNSFTGAAYIFTNV
jgi:hypothetical protein